MTVRADKLPPIPTILAAVDTGARNAANRARSAATPVVRSCLPTASGRLRRGVTGRVQRTPTGYALVFAASTRIRYPGGRGARTARGGVSAREVLRFVTRGTGVYGRLGHPITPANAKAFRLPNGWTGESVRGQRGHPYMARARSASNGLVLHTFEHGADAAARLVEGTF